MSMKYKVVKEFACAKKGDILTWNDDTMMFEFNYKDDNSERAMFMDEQTCEEYADDGYVIRIENEDECSCDDMLIEELSDKLTKIESTIDDLLTKYEEDHKQMNEAYNDQEIPTCVKVEADTVYYNLTNVLNTIKDKLVKTVKKADLYREFLKSLDGVLQLTDREQDIMILLIGIDINTPKLPGYSKNVISTENRRYLKAATGITSDNLSRYIGRLKDKGLIIKGKADDEWVVNPALIPEVIGDRVQLTIVLRLEKE